jgi:His/Glu/Gln/Arg/opine family amino acid ABC transporter permease subunit
LVDPADVVESREPPAPERLRGRFVRALSGVRWLRIGIYVVALLVTLDFVLWLGQRGVYNAPYLLGITPILLQGFVVTVELVVVVIPLGFGVGFLVGWARTTRHRLLVGFGGLYVDFFRSMPPLVLIAFVFIISLASLGSARLNPYLVQNIALWLGVIVLGLHSAAYQAEIVRAGILSVPAGQTEASDAIGMGRIRTHFLVVLPQAFRVSLPALGNEFSSVIKDTSLLNVIGWLEMSGIGLFQIIPALHISLFTPLLVWTEIGILYLVVTSVLNGVVRGVENAFKVPGLEVAAA